MIPRKIQEGKTPSILAILDVVLMVLGKRKSSSFE